jgi:hypothetical protein
MVDTAAAGLLLDRDEAAASAGRVRYADVLSGQVRESRVVRVHGCGRCGGAAAWGSERFVASLRPVIDEVLS